MLNFLASLLVISAFAQQKIPVKNFYPQGAQKSVEQIRIEFSQPMVQLGEFRSEAPAQSSCFKGGQGRWVDTKNWVYDFKTPLGGGVSCEVNVGGQNYRFNTGGPHVVNIFPRVYRPVDPEQAFVVFLDSEVKKESLVNGAYFVVEGLGDRIPSIVVEGGDAEKIRAGALDEYRYEKESFEGSWVALRSSRPFPAGAKVSFVWSKNIQSPQGFYSKQDETFEFTVESAFKAEMSCDREAPGRPCIPIMPVRLSFTAPIKQSQARQIFLQAQDGTKILAVGDDSGTEEQKTYFEFKGPFKSQASYKLVIPDGVKDDQGRDLSNKSQFPMTIQMGDDPSLLKFAADFGIIEDTKMAAIPVTLRRVEKSLKTQFGGWTGRLGVQNFKDVIHYLSEVQRSPYGEESLKTTAALKMKPIQVQKPLAAAETEVVGIPLPGSGFYVVQIQSALLGQSLLNKNTPFYVRSAALVTKYAVHAKYSNDEVWAWVTELDSTKPVAEAVVRIVDVQGKTVSSAKTNSFGLVSFKVPGLSKLPRNDNGPFFDGFFVVAEKGNDFSFTHSSWDRGIESWRYQLSNGHRNEGLIGQAVLDRSLLKPEETLSSKIVLRKIEGKGLNLPGAQEWPKTLVLMHDSGLQSYKVPLKWDQKNGTADWQWTFPAGTKLGRWILQLEGLKSGDSLTVGDVRVENFRVPLLQVRLQAAKPIFVQDKSIPVSITGNYLSGGPAINTAMKVRWSVEPGSFSPEDDDYQEFMFANGGIKEGVFRSGDEENARHIPQNGIQETKLDKNGTVAVTLNSIKYALAPQRLRVEAEYKDPNGEIQNSVRSFDLWPANIALGIKADGWSATKNKVQMSVVALDLQQKPLANQKVQVDLYTSRYYSHRKRLVGGFYAYEDFQEIKKIGSLCEGKTNTKGEFKCNGKTSVSGSVIAVVSSRDTEGRLAQANVNQWISADGETQWFGSQDNDRADLIPFKKSYEPGEVAEFQLRTPFKEAKVLVTVERESVLHQEVIDVKGDSPVLRIPIKKEYAPNVVISAFAIRGRLNDPKPTALVDLGKPAFKLGLSEVKVGWKENTLKVQVSTDRKTYHARDKAKVKVKVVDASGKPAAAGQIALVAVDEGLLELRDNRSWDLLSAMMGMHQYQVKTVTAQSFVMGKRHFGLKAVPVGGDGRGGLRRELFDTLLYWNPRVNLNKAGEADAEITLNDSTTSFRIVAVALQGKDQFGTGWSSIQSSQDVMILPGLSGVTRVGDNFTAGFTVRNASATNKKLTVLLRTMPVIAGLGPKTVDLPPGESQVVSWNLTVPSVDAITYSVTAEIPGKGVVDEIKKTQKVLPVTVPRIYQSEFGQWPDFNNIMVRQPDLALPGSSTVVVETSAKIGGLSSGLKEFWKNYAYTCLEQQVSKAVSLGDRAAWKKIEDKLSAYLDDRGLLKYFPNENSKGDVNLTSYVLSIAHEAGYSFSEDNEIRMVQALTSYARGTLKDISEAGRVDEVLKKVSAFETLSRYRKLDVNLLTSIGYQLQQWPLSTLVEWYNILTWEKQAPSRAQQLAEVASLLRNRFYFTAKRLMLKNEGLESMPWLMRDAEGASLRLLLSVIPNKSWQADVPRLMQGVLMRQRQGAWALTTTNAWGRLALNRFDSKFQSEKVSGQFVASLTNVQKKAPWGNEEQLSMELPLNQKSARLDLKQDGSGKPWITVSAKAAIPIQQPIFAGFNVDKVITPVEQKTKGRWSVGDTAKITLNIRAQAPQSWVVINDPIPAGSSILSSSWATAIERKEELMRFYLSWISSGDQSVEYTVRFNQAGTYKIPSTRIEAMYSPDVYAELPESTWTVSE